MGKGYQHKKIHTCHNLSRCSYCGFKIYPEKDGTASSDIATEDFANPKKADVKLSCCNACHTGKGNRTVDEFRNAIKNYEIPLLSIHRYFIYGTDYHWDGVFYGELSHKAKEEAMKFLDEWQENDNALEGSSGMFDVLDEQPEEVTEVPSIEIAEVLGIENEAFEARLREAEERLNNPELFLKSISLTK